MTRGRPRKVDYCLSHFLSTRAMLPGKEKVLRAAALAGRAEAVLDAKNKRNRVPRCKARRRTGQCRPNRSSKTSAGPKR